MSQYLSPLCNEAQIDANGDPLVGGQIFTYAAGTTTPAKTYTEDGVEQQNPVVLNAAGLPDNAIWLQGGQAYKFVIKDANDVTLRTVDDISGVNDPANATTADQWVIYTGAPTYISATSFSLAGDQTNTFQVGRRLKSANTGSTVYSTITDSSYSSDTGLTTVTVMNASGSLGSGLSSVSYGLLSATNPSIPYLSGQVLQEVFFAQQAGGSTTSTTLTGIGNSQNFTPKSTNSTLYVSITFEGCQNVLSGVNPQAFFAINVDGGYLSEHRLDSGTSAGGVGVRAPITLTGTYNNTSLSAKGINLGTRVSTTGASVDALLIKMSVREVQK